MNLTTLTEALLRLIEEDQVDILETPKRRDGRSFKWYIKSKISNNDLAWLDKEIDWDDEYRDINDPYTWYFPMKYNHNAERVAEAVRRNLNRGQLETKVDIKYPIDSDMDPILRIRFKNNKLERETGKNNLDD